jgi:hypothetical protein
MEQRPKAGPIARAAPVSAAPLSGNFVIFIDANLYLDLYLLDSGKKLLAALEEQRDYIFVTRQVVSEVSRNKVEIVARFLADTNKKLELGGLAVPDHLLGATAGSKIGSVGEKLRQIRGQAQATQREFKKAAPEHLTQICLSTDQVSKALDRIFARISDPSSAEVQHARLRKERGDPPGKAGDPLGDQVTWEQVLTRCEGKPKLWILTRDSDYAKKYEGKMFLNAFLYGELRELYKSEPEVCCFDSIWDGLEHFTKTTGVKAEKLPTPEEAQQIKEEQEAIPELRWKSAFDSWEDLLREQMRDRSRTHALDAYVAATMASHIGSGEVIPPPPDKEKK